MLQVKHITVRLADKAASWDDEDLTMESAAVGGPYGDGTLARVPTSTPKAQSHDDAAALESKKASVTAPRAIAAFVETEEEVFNRLFVLILMIIIVSMSNSASFCCVYELAHCNYCLNVSNMSQGLDEDLEVVL